MRREHPPGVGLRLLGVVVALATAACGSTVQVKGGTGVDGSGGSATGLGQPTSSSGASGSAGAGDGRSATGGSAVPGTENGSSTSGGGQGSPGDTGAPGGTTGAGPGGTGSAGGPLNGPGVTATSIALGIPYCNDCAAGNAAIGAAGEDPGDTRRYYQAVLDDVNGRGGVLGRKLVPVFREGSVNESNFDAASQATCEAFTRDNKVLMMDMRGVIAYQCAKKAGILVVGPGDTGPTYTTFPNLFAPSSVRLERLFEVTVRSMVKAGWQRPSAPWLSGKIGLITWDAPDYRYAMTHGYLKGLHDAGLTETAVRYVAVPQSAGALADASAAISSAVLAFRQRGIDHVFIGDGPSGVFVGAGLTFLFLQNAKSQGYYPRYAFNSNNVPDFPNHPKDQLEGMLAIDSSDSEPGNDEGITANPVRERCFAVMRKKGLPVAQSQTQGIAVQACSFVWFAEAVIARATRGTTLPHMIAAAESLGTSYRSPASYGNRIGRGQHDGAALFRTLRFDQDCSCIRYTSRPFEP